MQVPDSQSLLMILGTAIFGNVALLSSKTLQTKLSGLLLIPRLRARWKREALEEDAARENVAIEALNARITAMEESIEEERGWMRSRIAAMQERVDQVESDANRRVQDIQSELTHAQEYIRWVTAWVHNVLLWAAQHGHELPPPPWQGYMEWKKSRQGGLGGPYPREPPNT